MSATPSPSATHFDAGKHAAQTGRISDAEAHFNDALATATTEREHVEALAYISFIYGQTKRYAEAEQALNTARPFAAGHVELLTLLDMRTGTLRSMQGRLTEARALLDAAQASYKRLNLLTERTTTLINFGQVLYFLGDYQRTLDVYLEVLALSEHFGKWDSRLIACNNLGLCYADLGVYAEAERLLVQALLSCDTHNAPAMRVGPLRNLGQVRIALGQLTEGITLIEESIAVAREFGRYAMERQALPALAEAHYKHHDLDAAERVAEELLNSDVTAVVRAEARLQLGLCAIARGDQLRALGLLSEGLLDAESSFSKITILRMHAALAQLVDQPAIAAIHGRIAREMIMQIIDSLREKDMQAAFRATTLARSVLG